MPLCLGALCLAVLFLLLMAPGCSEEAAYSDSASRTRQEGPFGDASCSDGRDNDGDGLTDAEDPPCERGDFNVIIVGWDGVQRDHFYECLDRQIPQCADGLPHITELSNGVFWNNTTTNGFTATKPGWVQILSGYNAEVTGVVSNSEYGPLPAGYSIFEKAEAFCGEEEIATLFVAGKFGNTGGICSDLEDIPSQPFCKTKERLDSFENGLITEKRVGQTALRLLEQYKDQRILALFHFAQPDDIGHVCGENCPLYSASIVHVDEWLGRIVDKLRDLGIYERTFVYVISDHGFDETKWNHRNAPFTILATNDRSVMRSGDRKDLAPTILERYGIPLRGYGGTPDVDGYSLYSIPALACIPEGETCLDYPGAPECCEGLTLIGLDKPEPKFNVCFPATGGTGERSGRCTRCGDGHCKPPENKCNCPEDCPAE